MRLLFVLILLAYYFNNFVLAYLIMEALEFTFCVLVGGTIFSMGLGISTLVLVVYILIFVSVICFAILIRCFCSGGKSNFFNFH